MSTAPKVAPFVVLLRVMEGPFGHIGAQWQPIIVVVSIASMVLGSFAAIGQTNIKRLMAYSSIGHMGYALIGLAAGTEAGVRGVLIYLLTYVAMSAGAFACIIAMRRQGKAVEKISDLGGLAKTDFPLAVLLAIFMFSMAGVPPMAGFFGKLYVFLAAVQSGLWTLAIIGMLTSIVGCFYYLRVIKVMFFDAAEPAFDTRPASVSFVAVTAGVFTLLFFLLPSPFTGAADAAARALFG
jgi:NADH-quinone oxidoreductase subunit N